MLEKLFDIIRSHGPWAYAIVFFLVTAETSVFFGFIFPGATAAIFAGFLAQRGELNLAVVLGLVIAGSILGNLIGFGLGRSLRRPWLLRHGHRLGLRADHLDRVDTFFERHGGQAVFFGRFLPLMRESISFVAGASHLRFRDFFFYTVLGGVPWSIGVVMIGYLGRASWQKVADWTGRIGFAIAAIVALAMVIAWMHFKKRSRK